MPFVLVWNPLMMKIRNHEGLKDIFSRITFLYFGVSLIFIFSVYALLEPILSLVGFDSKFDSSISYIPLIMSAIAFGSLLNIYSAGIVYARKPIILVYTYFSLGILNFIVSYFAISMFGLDGIIATFLFFKLMTSLLIYYFSSRYFKFTIFDFDYLIIIILFSLIILFYSNYISTIESIFINVIYTIISLLFLSYFIFKREISGIVKKFLKNSLQSSCHSH